MTKTATPQNIAIPTNFESCAKNACIYAASLFKPFGSKFTLINSFESSGQSHEEFTQNAQESASKVAKESDLMKSLVGNELVEDLSVYGKPSHLSDELFNNHNFDCVVMGTSGAGEAGSSNTSDLLSRVDVNFLVIPEQSTFSPPKKTLLVTDLKNNGNELETDKFEWLLEAYNATLELGIVTDYGEELNNEQKQNLDHLKNKLSLTDSAIHHIHENDVIVGISKLSNSYSPDLIIALGRHKTFIDRLTKRSVTQELAEQLTKPLFITASNS